jgi:hypothetical protein
MDKKGYMTFAADMTVMRHESFIKLVSDFAEKVELPVLINVRDTNVSRIVDNNGKFKAEYEHQS